MQVGAAAPPKSISLQNGNMFHIRINGRGSRQCRRGTLFVPFTPISRTVKVYENRLGGGLFDERPITHAELGRFRFWISVSLMAARH
jgi:hypothetical protein